LIWASTLWSRARVAADDESIAEYRHNGALERGFLATGWIATVVLIVVSVWLAPPGSTYKAAFAVLVPMVWIVYWSRGKLALHPLHFGLYAGALLLHDLGSMGFYRRRFFGFEFDLFVHFYFGIVAGFVLYRALVHWLQLAGWKLWVAIVLLTLGISGVHELIEWSTTLVMGPERGMLKLDPDDPYDTQKDLLNNLSGALLASCLYAFTRHFRSEPALESPQKPVPDKAG
jgi:uncharacterized membrane protein YjdF